MRTWYAFVAMAALTCIIAAACGVATATQAPVPAAAPAQPAMAAADSVQRYNDARVREVLAGISGRENEPAQNVFNNIQYLGAVPARTFLTIMNVGYARALGVTCSHCHDTGDYSSDDKRPKRATREMAVMHRMINQELAKMNELKTPKEQNRAINCFTCHRGMIDPREP